MDFPIPYKEENEVCVDCKMVLPERYHSCINACSHLVSWAGHLARQQVIQAARTSVMQIRRRPPDSDDC